MTETSTNATMTGLGTLLNVGSVLTTKEHYASLPVRTVVEFFPLEIFAGKHLANKQETNRWFCPNGTLEGEGYAFLTDEEMAAASNNGAKPDQVLILP